MAQREIQAGSEPARRFLALLKAALAAGQAHVTGPTGQPPSKPEAWGWRRQGDIWAPRGDRVGWVLGDDLYLESEAAFGVAKRLAQAGGEPLAVGVKMLHKRLNDQGLLASTDVKRRRLVVRQTLEGWRREVLHFSARRMWDD